MIFRSPLIWFFEFHVYKVTNWMCALGANLPKIWSHIESTTVWQIRFDILMILNTLEYTLLLMENQRNVLYKCLINNLCDFRSSGMYTRTTVQFSLIHCGCWLGWTIFITATSIHKILSSLISDISASACAYQLEIYKYWIKSPGVLIISNQYQALGILGENIV